ncbi:MAG: type I-U CRISPR-associated helicase/endonuclease Cas3 [Alphaproteobacteria bacterium]|nr:type I-U CRISPR-associated helicase/endonuclease Cas3 [Alphaproteobacteria bacterium]MAS48434.1 type I-U CRISPR-associated helicase/endonuclease Cas3 [Alphaproteobacteria bacterium]MBN53992.1 type I-U CRISPR-associated helicase/endonuclease Cas3 [Alphaproteobacteria bacterium]OUT39100.1 MAG: type I-U CRISPR-associated helicase/endonuclease Cas3 [Micavibrio sp. TMED2]|tara:strand:+ start:5484 stop:9677 length:4194 start_codon:yes stop_codon:yes gene_type:complete
MTSTSLPSLSTHDFDGYYNELYGYAPFPWQTRLVGQLATGQGWPSVMDLPTGSGKTASLDIALFHLALCADDPARPAPMRIVLVVDRRLIVDDAFRRAEEIAEKLQNAEDGILKTVADRLRHLAGGDIPVMARALRGGMPLEHGWATSPHQPTILCSTVDQVGSRLLFRGYGISDRMKPVHAGLFGNDCLFLLDEVHLSEPFRQTLSGIARLRSENWRETGTADRPWQVVEMSATPGNRGGQEPFALADDDRQDRTLKSRLEATKPVRLDTIKGTYKTAFPTAAAAEVGELLKDDNTKAIGVVVNRVATARQIFEQLRLQLGEKADIKLMIGPARAVDRDMIAEDLDNIRTGHKPRPEKPLIVVATQCLEAGVDIDLDALVTEAAPLDALRQRFGRVNRAGRDIAAKGSILITDEQLRKRYADPVYGDAVKACWDWLNKQYSENDDVLDFGINGMNARLQDMDPMALAPMLAERPDAPILRPVDADTCFQTAPRPAVATDLTLYLHGPQRQPAGVQIIWRGDLERRHMGESDKYRRQTLDILSLLPPRATEAIEVPVPTARRWLQSLGDRLPADTDASDVPLLIETDDASERKSGGYRAFRWRGRDDENSRSVWPNEIRPGDVIVVPASANYGGADQFGWNPDSMETVPDVADRAARPYARSKAAFRLHAALLVRAITDEEKTSEEGLKAHEKLVKKWSDRLEKWLAEYREETDGPARIVDSILSNTAEELDPDAHKWLEDANAILNGTGPKPKIELVFPYGDEATDDVLPTAAILAFPGGIKLPDTLNAIADNPPTADNPPSTEDDQASQTRANINDATATDTGENADIEPSDREYLNRHSRRVVAAIMRAAKHLGLSDALTDALCRAAWAHDWGKADPRFQSLLYSVLGQTFANPEELLAKAVGNTSGNPVSMLPKGWRHEALSVRMLLAEQDVLAGAHDPELVLWLVGTHHGYGRPFYGFADEWEQHTLYQLHTDGMSDREPFDLTADIPAPNRLGFDWQGDDWGGLMARLIRRYGWWQLAWLESLLRLADHHASANPDMAISDWQPSHLTGAALPASLPIHRHRLEGLEPDNLLAFLALLGLLRVLEAVRPDWHPQAYWDDDMGRKTLRPVLQLRAEVTEDDIAAAAAEGSTRLAGAHDFAGEKNLNHSAEAAHRLLGDTVREASLADRYRSDMMAALMNDGAINRKGSIDPTPLCLMFGQGHQHFLTRFAGVVEQGSPGKRGRGKKAVEISAEQAMTEALFTPWQRIDPTDGFRWDVEEDRRYALRAVNPSGDAATTQHGANRLAAFGLSSLPVMATPYSDRHISAIPGGQGARDFRFRWPLWRQPASMPTITALLAQAWREGETMPPKAWDAQETVERFSQGKFLNVTRAAFSRRQPATDEPNTKTGRKSA